jgi:hypothetical protein
MRFAILSILLFGLLQSYGSHLSAGELTYKFLRETDDEIVYQLTLKLVRDCFISDVPLDEEVSIGLFNAETKLKSQEFTVELSNSFKQSILDCGYKYEDFIQRNICHEIGLYRYEFSISKKATNGFYLTYERCCRVRSSNLADFQGVPNQSVYYQTYMPSPSIINNSATVAHLSRALAAQDSTGWFIRVEDTDNDSIVIKPSIVNTGGIYITGTPVIPTVPDTLLNVRNALFKENYLYSHPFGTNNNSIYGVNGNIISLFPAEAGNFCTGLTLSEYRNGQLVGERYIDVIYIVLNTPEPIAANRPYNLVALKENDSVSLTWDNCENNVVYNRILRKSAEQDSFILVGTTTGNEFFFKDTSKKHSRQYTYVVQGVKLNNDTTRRSNQAEVFFDKSRYNSLSSNRVQIYPNPSNGNFTVNLDRIIKGNLKIYSLCGELVYNERLNTPTTSVSLSHLKPGVYFCEVRSNGIYLRYKLLIEQ